MRSEKFIVFILLLDIGTFIISLHSPPEIRFVIRATLVGLVIIIYVLLRLPFCNFLSLPKGEFTICAKWLLILSIVGGCIGMISGYPLRYVASDIWKFFYIPLLYSITVKSINEKTKAIYIFKYVIVWGIGIEIVTLIFTNWKMTGYLPVEGMPYIGVLGIILLFYPRFSKIRFFLSSTLVTASLLLSIASGRRLSFFLSILTFTLFLFIIFSQKARNNKGLAIISIFVLIASFLYVRPLLPPFSFLLRGYHRQIYFLEKKSEESSIQGILIEAKAAMNSFLESENPFKWVFGTGCGALWSPDISNIIFYSVEIDGKYHNIHATATALFYRNGLLGLLLFFYMGYAILKSFLKILVMYPKNFVSWKFPIALVSSFLCLCAFIRGIWGFHLFNPISQLPLPIYMAFANEYSKIDIK